MQFAIATVVSVGLNLAVNALTGGKEEQKSNESVLKSSYGFPIEKPFGKVRLRSRNNFWGIPIEDEEEGGKGGGRGEASSYATFAVMGGWEEIKKVTKIWIDSELFYEHKEGESLSSAISKARKRKYFDQIEIYLGTMDQNPSPTIETYEGIGNVSAYLNRFYVVFKKLEVNAGTGSYPTVDLEVIEGDDNSLPYVLNWSAKASGLTEQQIEIDPALSQYDDVNIEFAQDGGTIGDFIQELQKTSFFFTIDTGEKIIFRDYYTPETLPIINLTLDNLAAAEGNDTAIDRYLKTIPDDLDLPSELQFEYISEQRDYDIGFQPAFRWDAQHHNDANVRTRQVLTDEQANNTAWKTLEILWTQSRRIEKILLLPSIGDQIQTGNLITIPIDGVTTTFQVETKETGDNDLVEIAAVRYDKIDPNFTVNIQTFPNQPIPEIGIGEVVALDIPLIQDSDTDIGIYLGVTSPDAWKYGAIYVSENDGNSFTKLANFTGKSTVGTVTQIPLTVNPDLIDEGSEIIIELPNGGTVESIDETDFFNEYNLGLFGSEIIAWQNAELIAPNTYKLARLLRGLRGTERNINQHAVAEQFVLLKGTGKRLIRVAGDINNPNKTFIFKAVHNSQSLDSVTTETNLTVTLESLKPYSPVNPQVTIDTSNNDLTIEWTLRTRKYGAWRNDSDIVQVDLNKSYLEILDGNGDIMRSLVIENSTQYLYSAAEQITDFSSVQSQLNFNVYQASEFVGRGYPLEARNFSPTKFF